MPTLSLSQYHPCVMPRAEPWQSWTVCLYCHLSLASCTTSGKLIPAQSVMSIIRCLLCPPLSSLPTRPSHVTQRWYRSAWMGDVRYERSIVVSVTVFFQVTISFDSLARELLHLSHDRRKGYVEPFCNTAIQRPVYLLLCASLTSTTRIHKSQWATQVTESAEPLGCCQVLNFSRDVSIVPFVKDGTKVFECIHHF